MGTQAGWPFLFKWLSLLNDNHKRLKSSKEHYLERMELTNTTKERNAWKSGVRGGTGPAAFHYKPLETFFLKTWLKLERPESHPLPFLVTRAKWRECSRDGKPSLSPGTGCWEGPSSSPAIEEERGHLTTVAWAAALEPLGFVRKASPILILMPPSSALDILTHWISKSEAC